MLTEYVSPRNFLFDFRRRMNELFSDLTPEMRPSWPFSTLSGVLPASSVWETKNAYIIEMAAPGLTEDQIELDLVGNQLTIELAQPEVDETWKNARYWRQERSTEAQSVSLTLPSAVDAAAISAQVDNGLLVITLPKNAKSCAKKIAVSSK
ncbi:MAG: Hsp20/alpha crystallin family protein [Planctomycetia bacterium]|nr:Hsp20/alpha crystallin family protein [Planctomycetia bacterium]